jgi:hypothetical protein
MRALLGPRPVASTAVAPSSTPSWKAASVLLWLRLTGWAAQDRQAVRRRHAHGAAYRGGVMAALLAAVWLLLDYPWGLLAFVAIAALYGLR